VAAERLRARIGELFDEDDDIAIAAITVAELLVGVELADRRRRARRQKDVETIVATLPVEDYDIDVARSHAVLLAHARRAGRTRGAHDLVIAATALARRRTIVTADPLGFEALPGVLVRSA
jgi:tRNA(fMet)-specific endonuclease VapC